MTQNGTNNTLVNATSTPAPTLEIHIIETTKLYNPTYLNTSYNSTETGAPQNNNRYIEIHQYEYEQALISFIFILILIMISICIYWLFRLWGWRNTRMYKKSIQVRRPIIIIISYALILPWLLLDSISAMYLYCHKLDRSSVAGREQWTYTDGTLPIIFSIDIDYAFHFIFWFGFWSFVQLHMFRIGMLRYKYECEKEIGNFEWKDILGLTNVESMSFFLRYRSIWDNEEIMLLIQFIVAAVIMCLQIIIRVPFRNNPISAINEEIVIWVLVMIEVVCMVYIGYYIGGIYDEYCFKVQSIQLLKTCIVALCCWLIGIIISGVVGTDIDYFWYKAGTLLFWGILVTVLCYQESIWLLKRLDIEWMKQSDGNLAGLNDLKLSDILTDKEGFETMMRFLMKENSCSNLLCYVELSQFITRWTQQEMQTYANPNTQLNEKMNNAEDAIDVFPYFISPEFLNEIQHYEYIMGKYVWKNASFLVNISDELRVITKQQSHGDATEFLLARICQIRAEVWSLLKESFNEFQRTGDYGKLEEIIIPKSKDKEAVKEIIEIEQESMEWHDGNGSINFEQWEDEEKMVELPVYCGHDGYGEDNDDEKESELNMVEMTGLQFDGQHIMERSDIREWLNGIVVLPQYYNNFTFGGYESLDMIKNIRNGEELKEIGIIINEDIMRIMDEIRMLKENEILLELNVMAEIERLKHNQYERVNMEYKNDEESDSGEIQRKETDIIDGGMIIVTKRAHSKKVINKQMSVECVDPNEETPYL